MACFRIEVWRFALQSSLQGGREKLLLEVHEFIKEKTTEKVVWIEKINKYRGILEIGRMECVITKGKPIYTKEVEIVTITDFYQKYEDL